MADRENILAAIENRRKSSADSSPAPVSTLDSGASTSAKSPSKPHNYSDFDKDHDRRQEFRRLVDPGITRPNSREVANEAIKTLLMLAGNLIDHPEEAKYQRFKPTNAAIKRTIVDPKGSLEYAVELGFRPEVVNFQPYYVFHKTHWNDLLIGHTVLKEFGDREAERDQRLAKARAEEKAVVEAQKEKMRLAFLDDRKSRSQLDERERQIRAARAAKLPSPEPETEQQPPRYMPGSGHLLSGDEAPPAPTNDVDE